jgi:rhomboid protease GluP
MIKSQILPVVFLNLLISFTMPNIDLWGHIGGLIGGVISAYMLGTIENKKYNISNICLFAVYIGFLVYLAIFR